jgi:hypothetical protein
MSEKNSVRCLTVRQPWAWAILEGIKDVENREWSTSYRGPLLIHAAAAPAFRWAPGQVLADGETELPPMSELVYGAILGVVDLYDVVDASDFPPDDAWARGPYCWCLDDPRRLTVTVPCRGQMGLWTPPQHLILGELGNEELPD